MILFFFGLDHHVIDVYFHSVAELLFEHGGDQSLVGCPRILQPKRHNFVAVGSSWGEECSFVLVLWMHGDLMVASVSIKEAHTLMAYRHIYKLIDSG